MKTVFRVSHLACVLLLACTVQACAMSPEERAAESTPTALQVRTALNNNPAVMSSSYRVAATGTEVHLSGVAPTQFEKDQVLATAKSVPGVTNVVSDIAVDTSPLH